MLSLFCLASPDKSEQAKYRGFDLSQILQGAPGRALITTVIRVCQFHASDTLTHTLTILPAPWIHISDNLTSQIILGI
jgi:hypothetical protein